MDLELAVQLSESCIDSVAALSSSFSEGFNILVQTGFIRVVCW